MEGLDAFARALSSEVAELTGCLIATRDGRVLAVHPGSGTVADAAWRRIASVRSCSSAVVRFERETWCVAGRGPLVAFAVVGPTADPRAVIAAMDRLLASAEDAASPDATTIVLPDGLAMVPDERGPAADDRSADEARRGTDVDRAALVQEFSRLLQDKRAAADG